MRKANADLDGSTEDTDEGDESADEWGGFDEQEVPEEIDREEEYIDEDKYTTVTVETVDVSKNGLKKTKEAGDEDSDAEKEDEAKKRIWTKEKPKVDRPKKKKKKFRYEAPAERKLNRLKERSKGRAKAAARKSK